MNQQNRSDSVPNVAVNGVKLTADQSRLLQQQRGGPTYVNNTNSHASASDPNKSIGRYRSRSSERANKDNFIYRDHRPTDENWNIEAEKVLMGSFIGSGAYGKGKYPMQFSLVAQFQPISVFIFHSVPCPLAWSSRRQNPKSQNTESRTLAIL